MERGAYFEILKNRNLDFFICVLKLNITFLYLKNTEFSHKINIEIKNITERYRYFDFSLEQDIISKPDLKKRGTPETK